MELLTFQQLFGATPAPALPAVPTTPTNDPLKATAVLRPAYSAEQTEYRARKQCSFTWLVQRCWSRVVGLVNFIALAWSRDLNGIFADSVSRDPYVSEIPLYFKRQGGFKFEEFYLTSHPAILSAVLEPKRHSKQADQPFFMQENDLSTGVLVSEMFKKQGAGHENFILTCSAEQNAKLRTAIHAHLKPSALAARHNEIQEVADQTVAEWAQLDGCLNIRPLAKLYVNRVLSKLFLNYDKAPEQLQSAVDTFSAYLMGQVLGNGPKQQQLEAAQATFDQTIREAIANAGEHNVAYQMKEGGNFSDADVYLMAWTLFFAGIDNSSESLTWTLLMLAQNQDVQNALRANPDAMMGPVIAESLRSFTPAHGVARVLKVDRDSIIEITEEDGSVHRRYLEAGRKIGLRFADAAKREDLYSGNTEVFDPARFKEGFKHHLTLPFRPFGGGAHACPGWKLVIDEMDALLRTILRDYRITTKQMDVPRVRGTFLNKIDGQVQIQLVPLKAEGK